MSARRRFTEDVRRAILQEVEEHGLSITIRKHGISASHIYSWRRRTESEAPPNTALEAELRRLRQENQQLKKMVAKKELFIRIKSSLLKKNTIPREDRLTLAHASGSRLSPSTRTEGVWNRLQ